MQDHIISLDRSKLGDTGTTIFTVMSALAQQHDAINLSQGFPDFEPPVELLNAVTRHLQSGHNQYAPMPGIPELRHAIAAKLLHCYKLDVTPDTQITVTSGATAGLFAAITAFVHPGDEVIIFDPAYDSYEPAIRLAGGKAVRIPLAPPAFGIDWNRVTAAFSPRTRMIILNSPHNPTGSVLAASDIAVLQDLVRNTPIVILSDEVYEHIIFDGQPHESMLRYPELAARSLVISSFGKTFHMTGWKLGYCIAPPELTRAFRRVYQFSQFCAVSPMQWALADYLEQHPEYSQQLAAFYAAKRDRFCTLLQGSRLGLHPSAGTYFQLADYSAISDLPDTEFTRWLTTEKGVAAIPVSVFYEFPEQIQKQQKLVRFCFAKNDTTLTRAAEILCAI
jgi:methionine aminotransferase